MMLTRVGVVGAVLATSLGVARGWSRHSKLPASPPALTWWSTAAAAMLQQVPASTLVALAFEGVTVVDVQDGSLHPDQTVVVRGTRIVAVGPARAVRLPASVRRIDAQGKYLIPGLWDMHIHVMGFPDVFYPLLIANGVTGIRDMGTPIPLDTVHRWQREVTAGTRVGPRQLNAGMPLDESGPLTCQGWAVPACVLPYVYLTANPTSPARGRFLVDSLQAAGADFIKVREFGSREVYFAVAAEARWRGVPFAGHGRPGVVSVFEAIDSGQRSIEHFDLDPACGRNVGDPPVLERCRTIATYMRAHNAWTTISAARGAYPRDLAGCATRARLRYWPDSLTQVLWRRWARDATGRLVDTTAGRALDDATVWEARVGELFGQLISAAHAAGIPLLAGTDMAPLYAFGVPNLPGFVLQDELLLYAEGGFSPLAALQTATLNPAQYLRATDSLGTVATGKLADLVLLDADPLADLHNLRKIRAVVANGRYFDRAALDALLAGVAQRGAPHWAHCSTEVSK